MAMGPSPVGFAFFVGVKAVGYVLAAHVLKRGYSLDPSAKPGTIKIGLARTALGVIVGVAYGLLWFTLAGDDSAIWGFYVGLLPIRLGEWLLTIWFFLDRALLPHSRTWKFTIFGSVWSYALDAIGVGAALVIPGGIWVC